MTDPTPDGSARAIEWRRHDEVHVCVVPACGKRAGATFHVNAPERLAGRDWQPGDFIDLCPGHEHELRRVVAEADALGFGRGDHLHAGYEALGYPAPVNPLDRLREWND